MILLVQVNYREEEFKDAVSKWTNGTGVNIILDCIGGRLSSTIPRQKTETWGTIFFHLIFAPQLQPWKPRLPRDGRALGCVRTDGRTWGQLVLLAFLLVVDRCCLCCLLVDHGLNVIKAASKNTTWLSTKLALVLSLFLHQLLRCHVLYNTFS